MAASRRRSASVANCSSRASMGWMIRRRSGIWANSVVGRRPNLGSNYGTSTILFAQRAGTFQQKLRKLIWLNCTNRPLRRCKMQDDGCRDAQSKCNRGPIAAVGPGAKTEKYQGSHGAEFEEGHDHASRYTRQAPFRVSPLGERRGRRAHSSYRPRTRALRGIGSYSAWIFSGAARGGNGAAGPSRRPRRSRDAGARSGARRPAPGNASRTAS